MGRFAILNTVDWEGCRSLAAGELTEIEVMKRLNGCAWLFRVHDGVESIEEAARDAVAAFFTSDEGRQIRAREEIARLTWEEAVVWLPDEIWLRHGLEPIRHPEVERVLLQAHEDLLE